MNVEKFIKEDWHDEPVMMDVCQKIWLRLCGESVHPDHYTFGDFRQFSNEAGDKVLARALIYLATPRLQVLQTCLMYQFNDLLLELPEEEVTHYSSGEAVIHPEFGEPIAEADLLMCFTAGRALRPEGAKS